MLEDCFLIRLRTLSRSTLFPYTTLFRSLPQPGAGRLTERGAPPELVSQPVDRLRLLSLRGAVELDEAHEQRQRSEEHTSELQSHSDLVCRLLLEKKKSSQHMVHYRLTAV